MIFLFFLAYWFGLSFRKAFIISLILGLILMLFLWKRFGKIHFIIGLFIFGIGLGNGYISFNKNYEVYSGIVYESKNNYFLFSSHNERFYVYEKENTYEIGDILEIKAEKEELSFVTLESGFDFKNYLNNKGINFHLKPYSIKTISHALIKPKAYKKAFLSHFNEETSSLLNAIMFSNGSSEESVSLFRDFHLSRLLSASGVYVYAYLVVMNSIFTSIMKRKWSEIVSLGFLLFYFFAVFPKFSILKIIVLSLFKWLNKYKFNNKVSYFNSLGIVGLFFLILNKYYAYQESFVLGFLVPLIYYFANSIFRKKKQWQRKIFSSIFVYLSLIPFEMFFYNEIQIFSFFVQILMMPLFIFLGISGLLCYYQIPLYQIPMFINKVLHKVINVFSILKIGIYCGGINIYFIFVCYILLFLFIYYYSINYKTFYKPIIQLQILLLAISILPINHLITNEVTFLNVGQGDCCLIRKQETTVLIDVGGSTYRDIAKDNLIPYFKKKRIYNIDAVIITHNDIDHCGSLESLSESIKVKSVYRDFHSFPLSINGITFHNYNTYIEGSNQDNENSLVIGFNFLNKDFLIMGDAPKSIEKKIMEENPHIDCDIIKVGHHGSNTSSDSKFIDYLNPKEAIISVGTNYYGHPHDSVLQIFKKRDIIIKRTDELGSITYINYIWI